MSEVNGPGDMAVLVAALTGEVEALRGSVQGLTEAMDAARQRSRSALRLGVAVALGLTLDLVLSLTMGYVLLVQRDTNERLAANQAAQVRTRAEVLCPLYRIFLDSYDKARRDAMPAEQQRRYDENFEVIRKGYRTLECK